MELYIYVLLIFLNRIQGNLSQDGCKHIVLRRFEGKALNNFVFKKMKTDQDFCKALCYMDDRCLSINYITENQTCELSESDHVISPEHWVARPGSVYYRAENNCSCSGNEICRYNYELNSFQCTANTTASSPTSTPSPTTHPGTTSAVPTSSPATDTTASSPTSTPSPTTHPGTTSAAPTSSPECQLDFPRQSKHDYVKITSALAEKVESFTITFWLKVPSSYQKTLQIFSYKTADGSSDFSLGIKSDGVAEIKVNGGGKSLQSSFVRDATWQNIVIAWSNGQGRIRLYKNGDMISSETGLQEGKEVKAGGTIYLGQKHKDDGFDSSMVMRGSIADLEIWNNSITDDQAANIYNFNCTSAATKSGEILSWEKILNSPTNGHVSKDCLSTCPS